MMPGFVGGLVGGLAVGAAGGTAAYHRWGRHFLYLDQRRPPVGETWTAPDGSLFRITHAYQRDDFVGVWWSVWGRRMR